MPGALGILGTLRIVSLASAVATPLPSAVPSPQSTPLHEIARVRASAGVCGTLASLVLPVAKIVGENDRNFQEMRKPLARFQRGGSFGFQGGIDGPGSTALVVKGGLPSDVDDPDIYTPQRTMAASNIDRLFGIIVHNLDAAGGVVKQSWQAHPLHENPAIDVLRQRVQNVIDLQRLLAFRADDIAGIYFSNSGVASLEEKAERPQFDDALAAAAGGKIEVDPADPQGLVLADPSAPIAGVRKRGSAEYLASELRTQTEELSLETLRVENACDALRRAPAPSATP